ncbi:MAG: hypothetical protein QUU85_04515, partial [Candidatus Eisenbacteria bacterium]|nr:hypothetical protein [Candidatus Eisenbacteria bacterium]
YTALSRGLGDVYKRQVRSDAGLGARAPLRSWRFARTTGSPRHVVGRAAAISWYIGTFLIIVSRYLAGA